MFAERWIYDFMIYIYALSLVFSFSDVLHPNKRSHRITYILLITVWLLQSALFVLRLLEFYPMISRFDSLFLYAWMLVTFTLTLNRLYRMDVFVFAANLIGFIVMALNLFFIREDDSPLLGRLILSELIFIHVTLAVMAYVVFSLSSICAALYLINNNLLKQKKWNQFLRRLPSLARLQAFSNWLVMAGALFLLISMILGAIFAYQTVGNKFWFDPKILGSIWVLFAYGFVLYQWVISSWHGRRLAWWNTLSVFSIVLNFLLSTSNLSFHHWI